MSHNDNTIAYVVDDDHAVRKSLFESITAMGRRAVCFESAEQFLESFDRSKPGFLILDVCMPGMSGIQLHGKLLDDNISLPVILFTGHGDIPMGVESMKRGAIDFLEKPCRPSQLREAITRAAAVAQDQHEMAQRRKRLNDLLGQLSREVRHVMDGIVAGDTNSVIASRLDVSVRTVQFRRTSLMKKLNATDKTELIRISNQLKLVDASTG
jgi:two-component system response regulator FixJ